MNIPTTQELNRMTKGELQKMFRKAACIAASENCPDRERQSARHTLENIRRYLMAKAAGP